MKAVLPVFLALAQATASVANKPYDTGQFDICQVTPRHGGARN